jgi:hypothetical protein
MFALKPYRRDLGFIGQIQALGHEGMVVVEPPSVASSTPGRAENKSADAPPTDASRRSRFA